MLVLSGNLLLLHLGQTTLPGNHLLRHSGHNPAVRQTITKWDKGGTRGNNYGPLLPIRSAGLEDEAGARAGNGNAIGGGGGRGRARHRILKLADRHHTDAVCGGGFGWRRGRGFVVGEVDEINDFIGVSFGRGGFRWRAS